jgi:hypothetical protein
MRTGTHAQSIHVHDEQDPSDNSTQVQAPDASDAVPTTVAPAPLLDRFMQQVS